MSVYTDDAVYDTGCRLVCSANALKFIRRRGCSTCLLVFLLAVPETCEHLIMRLQLHSAACQWDLSLLVHGNFSIVNRHHSGIEPLNDNVLPTWDWWFGCGGGDWTLDLRVMSPTSYLCSTPRCVRVSPLVFIVESCIVVSISDFCPHILTFRLCL